jgi:hypothetical protein
VDLQLEQVALATRGHARQQLQDRMAAVEAEATDLRRQLAEASA